MYEVDPMILHPLGPSLSCTRTWTKTWFSRAFDEKQALSRPKTRTKLVMTSRKRELLEIFREVPPPFSENFFNASEKVFDQSHQSTTQLQFDTNTTSARFFPPTTKHHTSTVIHQQWMLMMTLVTNSVTLGDELTKFAESSSADFQRITEIYWLVCDTDDVVLPSSKRVKPIGRFV